MTAKITFWGVRGSIPCPESQFMQYGGHTSCVSVEIGEDLLIFDAGSGLQKLGRSELIKKYKTLHILLSHAHLDHIIGLPFFNPLYNPDYTVNFYAGHLPESETIKTQLQKMLTPPFSPITTDIFRANLQFHAFTAGNDVVINGHKIATHPLNHPGGCTGYRIFSNTRSAVYMTDTEHNVGIVDDGIINFIKNSDVLIYDCMFDDADFHKYIGWGHSTWQQGIKLIEQGNVAKLIPFHYDITASDEYLNNLNESLNKKYGDKVMFSKEGINFII